MILSENEWIDDLQFNGLKIVLSKELPRFTTDAVILSDFCKATSSSSVLDMGSGTGIISILVNARYSSAVTAIEIDKELFLLQQKSIELNSLSDKITSVLGDYTNAYRKYNGSFDVCVCNPPYFGKDSNIAPSDCHRCLARTKEISLSDIALAALRLLHSGGVFYMCYPARALSEAIFCLCNNKLEPKRIQFVRAKKEKNPYLVLIEAKKDAGIGVFIDDDLIILNEQGYYTDEMNKIYHRKNS